MNHPANMRGSLQINMSACVLILQRLQDLSLSSLRRIDPAAVVNMVMHAATSIAC